MTTWQTGVGGIILGAALAYSLTPTKTETKYQVVEKRVEVQVEKREMVKRILTVTKPDGTKTSETVVSSVLQSTNASQTLTNASGSTITDRSHPGVYLGALVGSKGSLGGVVYGAFISKQVLGPVSLGVWGLASAEFGVSLGLVL